MLRFGLFLACFALCKGVVVLPVPVAHGFGGHGLAGSGLGGAALNGVGLGGAGLSAAGFGGAGLGGAGLGGAGVGAFGFGATGLVGAGLAGHGLAGSGLGAYGLAGYGLAGPALAGKGLAAPLGHHVLKRSAHFIAPVVHAVLPSAVSHQHRVDVRTSPAIVSVVPVLHAAPFLHGAGHFGAFGPGGHF